MDLLLDTHTFLWFVTGDAQLSKTAQDLIEDENNRRLLSFASLWEMAIKYQKGRLEMLKPFEILIPEHIHHNDIELLEIKQSHIVILANLPYYNHKDPFDRLLIAQAMVENIPILSVDEKFKDYPNSQVIW